MNAWSVTQAKQKTKNWSTKMNLINLQQLQRILFVLSAVVWISQSRPSKCYWYSYVYLYREFFYTDDPELLSMDRGKCYNLSDKFIDKQLRSIDLNDHCVVLMDEVGCKGERLKLTEDNPCHINLLLCEFHDRARSIKFCD